MSLKKLRKEKGLSASQMATLLNISRPTFNKIEHDPLRLTDFFLADKIAEILDVPLEEVFPQFRKRFSPGLSTSDSA
ncbi:MAG TPA: helix-turn-helix transcriptional regulator [Mesotoga infera]|nr:helix-turn-helix transcriptional regulator [Mesotoga infera]HRR44028.1 helix-turn-helix transcriptional regulator [Mesotoga sp.]HRV01756.1 helix-turn-helix transcriptional regulator [Mesotoga sp.]